MSGSKKLHKILHFTVGWGVNKKSKVGPKKIQVYFENYLKSVFLKGPYANPQKKLYWAVWSWPSSIVEKYFFRPPTLVDQ